METSQHATYRPGQHPTNETHRPVEPIAVFFTEDGNEIMVHESKLTDAQREEGRYLLIGTHGAHWVSGKIDGMFQAGCITDANRLADVYEVCEPDQRAGIVLIGNKPK